MTRPYTPNNASASGRIQRPDVQRAEGDEARAAEIEDRLRPASEHPVADEAGNRDDEERRQTDDRVHGRAPAGAEVPFAVEVQRSEQRDAETDETEHRDRHQ